VPVREKTGTIHAQLQHPKPKTKTFRETSHAPYRRIMAKKLELNQVAEILKNNELPTETYRHIMEELNQLTQTEEENKPAEPPAKKQFVILLSDPENILPKEEIPSWVLQCPEEKQPASVIEGIKNAIIKFNASKKGRLYPVKSIGEALENIPAKYFKDEDLQVKTKTSLYAVKTDNQIPRYQAQPESDGEFEKASET
jgi:hypothetical protein